MRRAGSSAAAMVVVVWVIFAAALAGAQSTGTIQGTVTDAQGAAVPGATVDVVQEATGASRSLTTDGAGAYAAASLVPGPYRVSIALAGFGTETRTLVLEVARTVQLDVVLGVAGLAERVSVTASIPLIDVATVSVSQVINQRTVQDIPLNGRHFVDLGLLAPGSVTPPQNGFLSAPLRGQGSFAFNTAGNREDTVNFMINGVNLNDMAQNQITFQPSINTVQEFKVDNSTFGAEYGRNSGAIVNIATRSGSNQFHGEAFEFGRSNRLDSRNYFNKAPAPQSPFKRNQFGGALGGPLFKNQTFFFASYEGLRQRQGLDINSGVLSDEQRAAVADPVSRRLLEYIPVANATGASGARFLGAATAPVDIDQWTGDMSHAIGSHDTLHGYYAFQRDRRGEPTLQGNTIPGFGDTRHSHRQIMTLNETHVFGSSLVNEARFGFNRIAITFDPNLRINPADLGINNGVTSAIGLPQIRITGLGLNFGGPSMFPQGRTDTTFVFSDTATRLAGSHTLKVGGEFRRFSNRNFTSDPGTFDFATVTDFQSGLGNAFGITLGDRPSDVRAQAAGVFAQDSYRAAANLTFDLGVRFDANFSPTDTEDRFVVFDPATVSLVRVGADRAKVYDNGYSLSPRVGVVWDPLKDGRTSVRAAYALLSDQPVTNVVTPTAANPPLATPLSVTGAIRLASALTTATASGLAPNSVDAGFRAARMQSWNVNIERQFGSDTSTMIGYFGSKGDRLRLSRNLNQPVNGGPRPFPAVSLQSEILPGTTLNNIVDIASLGFSHYQGLWLTANRRLSHGLQFNGSYTLSKSTDTNSLNTQALANGPIQNSYDIADSEGPSDYDARHRFVVNAIYDVPFKGNRLVDGWQLGLIFQAQTGNPINIVTTVGGFNGVANTLRPDLIGDPEILKDPNRWFRSTVCDPTVTDPAKSGFCTSESVFALPVSPGGVYHFGNLPRNAVRGPGFGTADLSIIKNTRLTAAARVQLRVEVFNLFNQTNFGQPGRMAAVDSASFGVITNTRFPTGDSGSARQIQLAAKFLF